MNVQTRLAIGFLKGLILGVAVGVGVELGLHWPTPSGQLLAYLFAMGVGGTAGVFGGRAPWKEGAWLEALLKMIFGVGIAALLYWLASRYVPLSIPWMGGPRPWTSIPPLYLGPIGALFGALVEIDHAQGEGAERKASSTRSASATSSRKARVDPVGETEIEDAVITESSRSKKR